ncbi:MAG: cation:proton antiporter subunit C [Caulobacterales bacterium]
MNVDLADLAARINNIAVVGLMMAGLFITFASGHLVKRLIGLSIFQTAIFVFFITMGKVTGGTAPILLPDERTPIYSNPLPSVLILTAIVVSVATLAVGLAIVVRIKEAYGSAETDDVAAADIALDADAQT